MSQKLFKARWIVPVAAPPIENGCLEVRDGQIVSVAQSSGPQAGAVDYGDAVILPGLVNAHTHLELSFCKGRVAYRGSFIKWVKDFRRLYPKIRMDQRLRRAMRKGLQESLAAGVTTVADMAVGRRGVEVLAEAPINTLALLEVLGMGPKITARHQRNIREAFELCRQAPSLQCSRVMHSRGLAPHAPYSTDTTVYRESIEFCFQQNQLISTHLAEHPEEVQLLSDGTGPFRGMLEKLGLWDGSFKIPGCSPVEYARQMGLFKCNPLLVHVNYVNDSDLEILASEPCSVAFCPRSHRYFQHGPHRYREMLDRDINVCIGTDSLASNDSLSVLDELRFLRSNDATISNEQLMKMGTIAGARALGWSEYVGSLEPGKKADFAVIPLCGSRASDPLDDILRGDSQPTAVYVAGENVISPRKWYRFL